MMRNLITIAGIVVSLGTAAAASAQDEGTFFACRDDLSLAELDKSIFFPQVQVEAIRTSNDFCRSLNTQPGGAAGVLRQFGEFLEQQALNTDLGTARLNADLQASMRIMSSALGEQLGGRFRMPDFDVDDDIDENARGGSFFFSVSVIDENFFEPSPQEEESCAARFATAGGPDVTCLDVFRDLDNAINDYDFGYQRLIAGQNQEKFAAVSAEWDRYFSEARSQTTLDLVLTSVMARDHIRRGYIVGPPKVQWFALRPNVILQYHDGAPKGDQFKPGLSIEWLGFNFWDDSPLGFPIGLSVSTVYSDMPAVRTAGTGVTVHVNNSFSFGWSKHGDDDAFQVSMDLLQLIQSKQDQFDKYKAQFEKLR